MTLKTWTNTFTLCNKPRGVVSRDKVLERTEYYAKRTKQFLGVAENYRLLKIGHQAGAFQQYPKDPEQISPDTADISELMKKSFEGYRFDGIEIDIQIDHENIVDESFKDIYVVHNRLETKLTPFAVNYLKRNTLRKVLKAFTDATYHEQEKYIYIEIKCKDSERLDDRDKAAISGALNILDDIAKESSPEEAKEIRRHIGFASFNYRALERIDRLCNGQHDLFFIVASNMALGWLAARTIYGHFNFLGKRLKKVLSETVFLTGVWFDPCAVKNFSRIFNGINRTREEGLFLKPLKVFISTYLLKKEEYFDRLENEKGKLLNVEGLFFESMGAD